MTNPNKTLCFWDNKWVWKWEGFAEKKQIKQRFWNFTFQLFIQSQTQSSEIGVGKCESEGKFQN